MAVYNGEKYLTLAIESILGQSIPDFEFIIVNDGSSDRTKELLQAIHDDRITILTNSQNLGLTKSLNIALTRSQGVYIARQDADDISCPDRLQKQIEWLEKHPTVGLLGCDYEMIDTNGRRLEIIHLPTGDKELRDRLVSGNIFCHGSVMLRRTVIEAVGGYDERFPVTQDYDLWLRMLEKCEIDNLPEVLYQLRIDPGSVTRKKRALQLSYRRLALALADHRKGANAEFDMPENVLTAYPPEPERLMRDARWAAYLYYLGGDLETAGDSLRHGYEISVGQLQVGWQEWCLTKARDVACLRSEPQAGEEFIDWVYRTVNFGSGTEPRKKMLGRYHYDLAYASFQDHNSPNTVKHTLQAMRHNPRLVFNRGLLSRLFRSVFASFIPKPAPSQYR
jgi:glycosyltransferase involved in cell wall biosynthesis